jgi:hypothetical protein
MPCPVCMNQQRERQQRRSHSTSAHQSLLAFDSMDVMLSRCIYRMRDTRFRLNAATSPWLVPSVSKKRYHSHRCYPGIVQCFYGGPLPKVVGTNLCVGFFVFWGTTTRTRLPRPSVVGATFWLLCTVDSSI